MRLVIIMCLGIFQVSCAPITELKQKAAAYMDEKLVSLGYREPPKPKPISLCESRDAFSCLIAAKEHYDLGHYHLAETFYEMACQLHEERGCQELQSLRDRRIQYESGLKRELRFFVSKCQNKQDGHACSRAAAIHSLFGNEKEAISMHTKACEFNYAAGCFYLARAFEDHGDKDKAMQYLKIGQDHIIFNEKTRPTPPPFRR